MYKQQNLKLNPFKYNRGWEQEVGAARNNGVCVVDTVDAAQQLRHGIMYKPFKQQKLKPSSLKQKQGLGARGGCNTRRWCACCGHGAAFAARNDRAKRVP